MFMVILMFVARIVLGPDLASLLSKLVQPILQMALTLGGPAL